MDVEDVSVFHQYITMMEQQKKTLQAASKRKGERPKDRIPRAKAINDQNENSMSTKMMHFGRQATGNVLIHSSFLAPPYLPSTASLKDLDLIYIKDLQLETHHRGFYLILRVVTLPVRMTAIMVVMDDENEDVMMVQIYHQQDEEERAAEDIVRDNAICVIKEPFFKIMSDGKYGIRIDHITDLTWLPYDDEKVPLAWRPRFQELEKTADKWRQEGNAAVKSGDFSEAVSYYTSALKCCSSIDERRLILDNRSLANLKLGSYDATLEDTDCTLTKAQESEKTLYRAAQALYQLERFQECHNFLQKLLQEHPYNESGKIQMRRVSDRLAEQQHGRYDFKKMYAAIKSASPTLDCATFVGPVVVKNSDGRGRGIFTVREVKAGEMLLCEKAFAASYSEKTPKGVTAKTSILMNLHTNRVTIGTQGTLIATIAHRLNQNPSLIPAFTSLHHGSYEPTTTTMVDDTPVIDTFLIAQIVSLNAFGCPLTSLENQFPDPTSKTQPPTVDHHHHHHHSCGVWLLASFINHSCISNARRSFIGDMQIVRATRDIPADTEITFWYHIPAGESYAKRQDALQTWGFKCDCAMCVEDGKTPKQVVRKRGGLRADIDAALEAGGSGGSGSGSSSSSSGVDVSKIERLLTALEQTYKNPPTLIPRFAVATKYPLLTRMYVSRHRPHKVISTAMKTLQSLGFVVHTNMNILFNGNNVCGSATSPSGAPLPLPLSFQVQQWGLLHVDLLETWLHLWMTVACLDRQGGKVLEGWVRKVYGMCVGEEETFDEGGDGNGEIERIRRCAYG